VATAPSVLRVAGHARRGRTSSTEVAGRAVRRTACWPSRHAKNAGWAATAVIVAEFNGRLSTAVAGGRAHCPGCRGDVYARLPPGVTRHWAHLPLPDGQERDCDHDAGEMTEWHRSWQYTRTDPNFIEVVRGDFRADVINAGDFVIEFQHSGLSPEKVEQREQFWGRGLWVVDGTERDGYNSISVMRKPTQAADDPWRSYRWPRSPSLLFRAKWPCWIDLGEPGLLQVWGAEAGRGNGWLVPTQWFIDEVVNGTKAVLRRHDPKRTERRIEKVKLRAISPEIPQSNLAALVQECPRPPLQAFAYAAVPTPIAYAPVRHQIRERPVRVRVGKCVHDGCPGEARLYPGGWRCLAHAPGRTTA
jgi:hypothetical protein